MNPCLAAPPFPTHHTPTLPPPQSAVERREGWTKFGDAASERASDIISAKATEDIPFERVRPQKQTQEDKGKMDFQTAMAGSDKAAIVGNIKDMLYKRRMERQLLEAKGLLAPAERPPGEDDGPSGLKTSGTGWVAPSMRQRLAGGETMESLALVSGHCWLWVGESWGSGCLVRRGVGVRCFGRVN